MDRQAILKRFMLIANLTPTEASPWQEICDESAEEIEARLNKEVFEKSEERRLNFAAASLSFYKYTLYKFASPDSKPLVLGDTTEKTDIKQIVNIARIIWENAHASIANLLQDQQVLFKTI